MCDFRKPPKVRDNTTGQVMDSPYLGFNPPSGEVPGVALVGATGVGYAYWDGGRYWSGYSDTGRYTFLFEEGDHGHNCGFALLD